MIVTYPFKYKTTAENNNAVRSFWVFVLASGFACTIVNFNAVPYWGKVFRRIDNRMVSYCYKPSPDGFGSVRRSIAKVGRAVQYPLYVLGSLLLILVVPLWVLGPFVRYVAPTGLVASLIISPS